MTTSSSSATKAVVGLFQLAFGLYVVVAMGFGVYFNWTYARDNGFMKWLLLGQIVPSAKAFVWPYFAYQSFEAKSQRAAEDAALDHSARADSVRMVLMTTTSMYELLREAVQGVKDTSATVRMLRAELAQVDGVSQDALDAVYQGWGGAIKEGFLPAMRSSLEIIDPASPLHKDRDAIRSATSVMLGQMSIYDTWFVANRSAWMEALLRHRIIPEYTDSVGVGHRVPQ